MATTTAETKDDQPADEACAGAANPNPKCMDRLIRNYVFGTMGVSLIPAPALDLAAITGLQLKMICDLAEEYDVPFKENVVRSLIMSLIGTLGAGHLALGSIGSALKLIPGVGYAAAALSLPALVGGATYALGRVFKAHFEAGGTLLDFDVDKMRGHFKKEYEAGLDVAKSEQKKKTKA